MVSPLRHMGSVSKQIWQIFQLQSSSSQRKLSQAFCAGSEDWELLLEFELLEFDPALLFELLLAGELKECDPFDLELPPPQAQSPTTKASTVIALLKEVD